MALTNLDENVKWNVRFRDGSIIKVEGYGTEVCKCTNKEKFDLKNVYYIHR